MDIPYMKETRENSVLHAVRFTLYYILRTTLTMSSSPVTQLEGLVDGHAPFQPVAVTIVEYQSVFGEYTT